MSYEEKEMLFVVRAKLPFPDIYPRTGRSSAERREEVSEEERKNYDAIFAMKPFGFEVKWRYNEATSWPMDEEGFVWVPLYLSDQNKSVEWLIEANWQLKKKLERIKEAVNGC